MTGLHAVCCLQVGDGSCQAKNAVVASGAEGEALRARGHEPPFLWSQSEHVMEVFPNQLVVGFPLWVAFHLPLPGAQDAVAQGLHIAQPLLSLETSLGSQCRKEQLGVYRVNWEVDVNAVQQGATDPL